MLANENLKKSLLASEHVYYKYDYLNLMFIKVILPKKKQNQIFSASILSAKHKILIFLSLMINLPEVKKNVTYV